MHVVCIYINVWAYIYVGLTAVISYESVRDRIHKRWSVYLICSIIVARCRPRCIIKMLHQLLFLLLNWLILAAYETELI